MKILVVAHDLDKPKRVVEDRIFDIKKSRAKNDKDGYTQKSINQFKELLKELEKGDRQITLRFIE